MAVPIKPVIATKTDYASRPSIPSSQKQNATEFNLLVSAIRANYERLILEWSTDIVVNTTLPVGQYVLKDGIIYKITTSYNVGSPITWDPSKATTIINTGARPVFVEWDATGDTVPVDADGIGSGAAGAILAGDQFFFGGGGGNFNPLSLGDEFFPANTVITAKQNSPTLETHYIFKA